MDVTGDGKQLRDNLICAFEYKFNYELESEIYFAASVMDVSQMRFWFMRTFAQEYIGRIRNSIKNVASQFVDFEEKKTSVAPKPKSLPKAQSLQSIASDDSQLLSYMAKGYIEEEEYELTNGILNARRGDMMTKEVESLFRLFEETDLKKLKSTSGFWYPNASKFSTISQLALILLNTPSSSAFVERFFNLCGVVCKQRAGSMSAELLETRSMLKVNMGLLEEYQE
jgi:hypothetical protein